jgi:hypothetical protein
MAYLKIASETTRLGDEEKDWAGFYGRLLKISAL